jgi:hypothetical protein
MTEGQAKMQILREHIASNLAFLVVRAHRRRQSNLTMQTAESEPSDRKVQERSQLVQGVNENPK